MGILERETKAGSSAGYWLLVTPQSASQGDWRRRMRTPCRYPWRASLLGSRGLQSTKASVPSSWAGEEGKQAATAGKLKKIRDWLGREMHKEWNTGFEIIVLAVCGPWHRLSHLSSSEFHQKNPCMSCVSPLHNFFDRALKRILLKVFPVTGKDNICSVTYSWVFGCSCIHLGLGEKFNRLLTLHRV